MRDYAIKLHNNSDGTIIQYNVFTYCRVPEETVIPAVTIKLELLNHNNLSKEIFLRAIYRRFTMTISVYYWYTNIYEGYCIDIQLFQ